MYCRGARCLGFALLDGDHIGKLAAMLSVLPGHLFGTLTTDGKPVALPLAVFGIPVQTTGHIANTDTRAAVALGPGSEVQSEQLLRASANVALPLVFFHFDLPWFQELLAAIHKPMDPIPFHYGTLEAAVQTDDDGLRFDFRMTW
jgi:hypothetical protein